ncbi:MAG: Ig-like domain repeat protein [Chloroflexi bacterium]|nr:Ig-like domain repeat protein [Chloroflexota bacterium]
MSAFFGLGLGATLTIIMLLSFPVQAAHAAGQVGDGTPESCTDAALDAALAGGGAVTFNCGPGPVVIVVRSTKVVTGSVTVDGGGLVTLSGGGRWQVLVVRAGATLTLRRITLANGYTGPASAGGAAIDNAGALALSDSTISGHRGLGAGAVRNRGTLTVTGSAFSDNRAGRLGGAIAHELGELTVETTTFSNNRAPVGGAIADETAGVLALGAVTFVGNGDGDGGALSKRQGVLILNAGTFLRTSGVSGAALALGSARGTIFGSRFAENQGVAVASGGILTVRNTRFAANGRGGIAGGGTMTVSGSTFLLHEAAGPAIRSAGRLAVASSTFASNAAAIVQIGDQASIVNSTFAENGRAVDAERGAVAVTNATFVDNGRALLSSGDGATALVLRNSIVARRDGDRSCDGQVVDGGHNLETGDSCGLDPSKGSLANADPLLEPLAENGGPTLTYALRLASPAINRGSPEVCTAPAPDGPGGVDQRGIVHRDVCDVGAYESPFVSTRTELTASGPASFGDAVALTAHVVSRGGTPSGRVTFTDGGALLGTIPLDGTGRAVFATSVLTRGVHVIGAQYGGADGFDVSAAAPLTVTIAPAKTALAIVDHSPSPSLVEQPVYVGFSFSYFPRGSFRPTGTVTVSDGSAACTVPAAVGACALLPRTSGTKLLTATYSGDDSFEPSRSPAVEHEVLRIPTEVRLSIAATTGIGEPVTLRATVIAGVPRSRPPEGTVTFRSGDLVLAEARLQEGGATAAIGPLLPGRYQVVVEYGGDDLFLPTRSRVVEHEVVVFRAGAAGTDP